MVGITARELEVLDGGGISTDTNTAGSAGIVTIRADRLVVASGRPNGLSYISSRTYGTGKGGNVEITAGAVEVRGEGMIKAIPRNADISTSTFEFGSGQAGNVIIHADTVVVSGSGGEIASRTQGTGNGEVVGLICPFHSTVEQRVDQHGEHRHYGRCRC